MLLHGYIFSYLTSLLDLPGYCFTTYCNNSFSGFFSTLLFCHVRHLPFSPVHSQAVHIMKTHIYMAWIKERDFGKIGKIRETRHRSCAKFLLKHCRHIATPLFIVILIVIFYLIVIEFNCLGKPCICVSANNRNGISLIIYMTSKVFKSDYAGKV